MVPSLGQLTYQEEYAVHQIDCGLWTIISHIIIQKTLVENQSSVKLMEKKTRVIGTHW